MYVKHVIHHSHITGEIIEYSHGFCNRKVRENKNNISVTAHNLFGFDFFFLLKSIRFSIRKTKDISTGGSNLTNINYANIGEQVKFIDTMKYYQQSLAKLAESMMAGEKGKLKKESKRFIKKHDYFGNIFLSFPKEDQECILDYMCSGKGVIPYKMMNSFVSLEIVPEGEFFNMEDFHSTLKNSLITDQQHLLVKTFYSLLKMRNLGDLNNLYNFQDTIILCEIFKSNANFLNEKFKFNPRKYNSASSFSGCVHRDKSKCIITLPTCSEHVELFEKTLIGGFSSVSTRLAFDTNILLPNSD